MNPFKKILSSLLLFLYVLSGAHGAVTQCHDLDHRHLGHSHGHEAHNHGEEDISLLHAISHEIVHSFAHFIEHNSHDHDCCDILIFVEVHNNKKVYSSDDCFENKVNAKSNLRTGQIKCQVEYYTPYYKEIFLSHSSLRGPPNIV